MPCKTDNWKWDQIGGGLADFVIDDLYPTKHALARAIERGISREELRTGSGIIVGHKIVTAISRTKKPKTLDGALWSDATVGVPQVSRERLLRN